MAQAARHEVAIADYQEWLNRNPDATRDEKHTMFNYFIDRKARAKVKKKSAA